jgi:hypothetical protein
VISYAENQEDVVLARLFTGSGFYVDVGAGHPIVDSVTHHFYEHGWRGLNVQPLSDVHALLCEHRPRDRCVQAMVSDTGTSGVRSVRLSEVLDDNEVDRIDFLRIAARGAESKIVDDTDWTRIRPRVLVVAAEDGSPSALALLDAGYVCTLFDGVNRFYAETGDTEAIAALSVPANVRDGARPHRWVEQVEMLEEERESVRWEVARLAVELRAMGQRADPAGLLLADPVSAD